MKMGAGNPAGCANFAEHLACRKPCAWRYTDFTQVAVHRYKAFPMVHKYRLAIEKKVSGFDDAAGDRRNNLSALSGGNIHTAMGSSWLIVEKAT